MNCAGKGHRALRGRVSVLLLCVMAVVGCSPAPNTAPPAETQGVPPVAAEGTDTAPPATQGLNVVWVVLDACRAKNLSCMGYERPTSPTIDRLAAEGALFRQHFCQGGWTAISVPSYMTGRYFPVDSLYLGDAMFKFFPRELPPEERSAPEIFRANGYHTVLVTAHPFLSQLSRLAAAFDSATLVSPPGKTGTATADLGALLDTVKTQLDQPHDKPLFMYIHAMDTHYPYRIHPQHDQWVVPGYSGKAFHGGMPATRDMQFDETDKKQFSGMYDGSIHYADAQIGRLLALLDDQELRKNTLFILSSDHGELLGEDGSTWGHFGNVYDEGFHIPLVMTGPGIPAGCIVNAFTESTDILPTLVDLLGLKTEARFDGQSLRGIINGTADRLHSFVFSKQGTSNMPKDTMITNDTFRWVWHRKLGAGELLFRPATPQTGLNKCDDPAQSEPFSRFLSETVEPKYQAYQQLKPKFVRLAIAEPGAGAKVEFQPPLAPVIEKEATLSFSQTLAWTPDKDGVCWIAPAVGNAVVRIALPAPPGRYGLFIIQNGKAAVDGHPASSLKLRVGGAEQTTSLAWNAGRHPDGDLWTNEEPLPVESDGMVKIELQPDNPEFWCAIWGVQLIEMGALSGAESSGETKALKDQMKALGYL